MHESRRQAREGAYASSRLYRVAETVDLLAATQRHGRLADNFHTPSNSGCIALVSGFLANRLLSAPVAVQNPDSGTTLTSSVPGCTLQSQSD